MSRFFSQMENMINERLGANQNRNIVGVITKVNSYKKTCSVCPIDMDMIWEMKSYYARTKIDKDSIQKVIEEVDITHSESLNISDFAVGDKVCIAYNEDRPYILQKIKQSYSTNKQISINEDSKINVENWMSYSDIDGEYNPIPYTNME